MQHTHVSNAFSVKYDVTFCFQRRDLLFCCVYERTLCFVFLFPSVLTWLLGLRRRQRVNTSAERLGAWMFQWSRTNLLSVFVCLESPSAAQERLDLNSFRRLSVHEVISLKTEYCSWWIVVLQSVVIIFMFFLSQFIDASCLLSYQESSAFTFKSIKHLEPHFYFCLLRAEIDYE